MKDAHWRIVFFAGTLLLAAAVISALRLSETPSHDTALERLRDASPLLALAPQTPQVRAIVWGDPATAAALNEAFWVSAAAGQPKSGETYDLIVIAKAPRYRSRTARHAFLNTFVRPLLDRNGAAVIPGSWAAAAVFPCRRTAVPGTGGHYFFLTPNQQPEPTLAELSRRLTRRQERAGVIPCPDGFLTAYFGEEEFFPPPLPFPSLPILPVAWRWAGGAVLLLLLLAHVILAGRGPETAARCYAMENGAAVALFLAGVWLAFSRFQIQWGIDPVWLLPLTALFWAGWESRDTFSRRAGWVTTLMLTAALLLLPFYGAEPWCGLCFAAAAAGWLFGAGTGAGRTAVLPLLLGAATGGAAAWFLARYAIPPWLFFALAFSLKITFLLRI